MNSGKVLLYGASGHARVICSIYESMSIEVVALFDDNIKSGTLNNYTVVGNYDCKYYPNVPILVSIGDNKSRKEIVNKIKHCFSSAIHNTAIIDNQSFIGEGTSIFHNVIIQRGVDVGKHVIINTNASIDHDCVIHDFVHVSPSATLCGNVQVMEGTMIGANATIIPNIKIGKWCVIGAGAVVTHDIPDYSLVVGIPGKIIKTL